MKCICQERHPVTTDVFRRRRLMFLRGNYIRHKNITYVENKYFLAISYLFRRGNENHREIKRISNEIC